MWHSACALRQVLLQQGHLLTAIIATNTPTTPIEMTSVVVDAVDPVPLRVRSCTRSLGRMFGRKLARPDGVFQRRAPAELPR